MTAIVENTLDVAEALLAAYTAGDADRFYKIGTYDGIEWEPVFRRLAKLPAPSPAMQLAFEQVWMEHKHMAAAVGNHRLVVTVARKMLSPYRGSALRLYRGPAGTPVTAVWPLVVDRPRRGGGLSA
jgi:hypothetical protein